MKIFLFASRRPQQGMVLFSVLLILLMVLLLGLASAQIAMQSEKSSRNDRDRQIAFQAAEAALLDAETDIEHSPDMARSRSHLFSHSSALGFPDEASAACGSGAQNPYLGLCRHAAEGMVPSWHSVDFLDDARATTSSVPYGQFTGRAFHTANGSLPGRVPRYIVELMLYRKPGERSDVPSYFYRITAIGFGTRETTQVVLQTVYRKAH
ncbi:PilX N-terminal domain-containing pilus assembly protein [Herminiimonas sp. NPDC097707]|uniref:pilus assembly PilX family protein n=1 Tax=Herminiimonas sp. NPDC097707 TaxID=3364007 RepID=UPI00383A0E50